MPLSSPFPSILFLSVFFLTPLGFAGTNGHGADPRARRRQCGYRCARRRWMGSRRRRSYLHVLVICAHLRRPRRGAQRNSWMDMDMDAHATELQLIGHGLTATTSSSSCFSSGGSGDNGMVIVTTTPKSAAASGSQKRARTPSSPSQGAELLEYSKKQRANNMETQSSTAKSQHERKEMRERISERKETLLIVAGFTLCGMLSVVGFSSVLGPTVVGSVGVDMAGLKNGMVDRSSMVVSFQGVDGGMAGKEALEGLKSLQAGQRPQDIREYCKEVLCSKVVE
uniref:Uncharacterized protein n=1 Tax=Oryza rufipogon TaxID=4529 RepID=A0A0E0QH56_ORYRU